VMHGLNPISIEICTLLLPPPGLCVGVLQVGKVPDSPVPETRILESWFLGIRCLGSDTYGGSWLHMYSRCSLLMHHCYKAVATMWAQLASVCGESWHNSGRTLLQIPGFSVLFPGHVRPFSDSAGISICTNILSLCVPYC
jgi:hypothetical protein